MGACRYTVNKIWVKHVLGINTTQTHLIDVSCVFKKTCNAFYTKHWCFQVIHAMCFI